MKKSRYILFCFEVIGLFFAITPENLFLLYLVTAPEGSKT